MAGESYGVGSHVHLDTGTDVISCNLQGRYLPLFASEIYDQNARLAEAGFVPVNLQSVMIGKVQLGIVAVCLSLTLSVRQVTV